MPLDGRENQLEVEVAEQQMDQETESEASLRRRKQDLPTENDTEVKYVGWVLEAQRVAAETITNLCSSDDDGNYDTISNTLIQST